MARQMARPTPTPGIVLELLEDGFFAPFGQARAVVFHPYINLAFAQRCTNVDLGASQNA